MKCVPRNDAAVNFITAALMSANLDPSEKVAVLLQFGIRGSLTNERVG